MPFRRTLRAVTCRVLVAFQLLAVVVLATSLAHVAMAGFPAPAQDTATTASSSPSSSAAVAPAIGGIGGTVPVPTATGEARGTDFGYDYFSGGVGGVVDGPIDDDYLLSPRDEVVVTIWGDLNETMNLMVGEQGFIELPDDSGRIQANGVRLRDLRPLLLEALSQIRGGYINATDPAKSTAFVDIRLGKIRPLLVHVVGEVNHPGAYSVSAAVANVINLLNNAGGVRPTGSLRDIRIKRADGSLDSIDLYGFFLRGDLDQRSIRLQPGDYLIVPIKTRTATVSGEVRRPMRYELLADEGLKELVELAGGFKPTASMRQAQLRRNVVDQGEIYLDLDLTDLYGRRDANLDIQDQDELIVHENVQVRKNIVTIAGEGVKRAGTYEFIPSMRVGDLIEKAGGLREHAYLQRADIVRTDDDFRKRLLSFPLDGLFTKQPDGTFVLANDLDLNVPLREMDQVHIQSTWGMAGKDKSVTLAGHVKEPGPVVLAEGMTLDDVIFMHGGFQDPDFARLAHLDTAHVTRRSARGVGTELITFDLGALLRGDAAADFTLVDGDVIQVYADADLRAPQFVEVTGLVGSPGRFPFADNMTIADLLVLAGGLAPDATHPEVLVTSAESAGGVDSTEADSRVVALTVTASGLATAQGDPAVMALSPSDRVTVRHVSGFEPMGAARVSGEVVHGGSYSIPNQGQRLSDLVRTADGLRPLAYPEGATLRRRSGAVALSESEGPAMVEVTIDLAAALASPGGSADLETMDGDLLFVPRSSGMVTIAGAVGKPLVVQHVAGAKLSDYLDRCGGLLPKADRARILVTAPNNATTLVGPGDPVLLAGSTVNVPLQRESERLLTVEVKGAVNRPALVQHIEDARLGYYLGLCGGYSTSADPERVVVLLPDGSMLSGAGAKGFNPEIPPGAIIVVTARPVAPEAK